MALKAGRVGLATELVDEFGYLKEDAPSGQYYTKTQADNKFETKTHVNNTFQKKTLEVPIEMLSGTKLTVETALEGLNTEKQNTQLSVPIEMLSGTKLTVESALGGLNSEKITYADNGVLGAKNCYNLESSDLKENSGATYTVSDGEVTINCTTTEFSGAFFQTTSLRSKFASLANVPCVFSFEYKSSVACNGVVGFSDTEEMPTTWTKKVLYVNNPALIGSIVFYNLDTTKAPVISARNFMLRLASDPDDTYVPYAMTNKELTDLNTIQSVDCENVVSGATANAKKLYKYGKVVFLTLNLAGVTADAGDTLATIPDGYRPVDDVVACCRYTGGVMFIDVIQSSGNIKTKTSLSATNCQIYAVWMTD